MYAHNEMKVCKKRDNKTHQVCQVTVVVTIVVVQFSNKLVQLGHFNCDYCWNLCLVWPVFVT